jgi:hypothetical protein
MIAGLSLIWQPVNAQTATPPVLVTLQQPPSQPSGEQDSVTEKTFTGKIVKSGDKLVLSDTESRATYQLDDQQKAQDFVNKTVKVTGILDASTGTIRVTAIEPA